MDNLSYLYPENRPFFNMVAMVLIVALLIVILSIFFEKKKRKLSLIKQPLRDLYRREAVFLCDGMDILGTDKNNNTLVQLYGEVSGIANVHPGTKIILPEGAYEIAEVYNADIKASDVSVQSVSSGTNAALFFYSKTTDYWNQFRRRLKSEKVVVLKLQ